MAPEQATGRAGEIGPATDVYSLGAILYQLLTGQPPHRGATALETLNLVIASEPIPPRAQREDIPGDLETICRKCLEKRPERRYATARQLADELERFLAHEPILARPANAWRRLGSWGLRHPWAITALVSCVIVGLSVVTFGLWERTQYLVWLSSLPEPRSLPDTRSILRRELSAWMFFFWFGWTTLTIIGWGDYHLRRSNGGHIGRLRLGICAMLVGGSALMGLGLLAKLISIFVWADVPLALMPIFVVSLLVGLFGSLHLLLQWTWEISAQWAGKAPDWGVLINVARPGPKLAGRFNYDRALRVQMARDAVELKSSASLPVNVTRLVGIAVLVVAAFFTPPGAQPWWIIGAILSFFLAFGLMGMLFPRQFLDGAVDRSRLLVMRCACGVILIVVLAFASALTLLPPDLKASLLKAVPIGAGVGLLPVLVAAGLRRRRERLPETNPEIF